VGVDVCGCVCGCVHIYMYTYCTETQVSSKKLLRVHHKTALMAKGLGFRV
jgi:hypothetical protein